MQNLLRFWYPKQCDFLISDTTWFQNGRACLGDLIYRYISSDHFSPECLLDCLEMSSEHQATEIANRVEASIYVWRKRTNSKPATNSSKQSSKSSWEMVKELMVDSEKRELLAERAETLLLCLKQRFPGLPQTTLDMSKIQYNKVCPYQNFLSFPLNKCIVTWVDNTCFFI